MINQKSVKRRVRKEQSSDFVQNFLSFPNEILICQFKIIFLKLIEKFF